MSSTGEGSVLLPPSVLRNLNDKLYEKRKAAALEVEQITKRLAAASDWNRISALITLLVEDYALSAQANHRKGGLIGLAAATVGLASETERYLDRIVPPVLQSFTDQDSRVRYYACEALYNIAKVARNSFIMFFNEVFDALCKLSADADANVQNAAHLLDRLVKDIVTESTAFSIQGFIPLLRDRLNVLNPYVRQFLVGWIAVLDSVPDIDMLEFLPDFLDGLLNMLSDPNREIRQQADAALAEFLQEIKSAPLVDFGRLSEILVARAGSTDEFTRLTAITWLHEFVDLGREELLPFIADILGAILPCLSHPEERIRAVAAATNTKLLEFDPAGHDEVDIQAILTVLRREMGSGMEATRLKALKWLASLLDERSRPAVLEMQGDMMPSLLETFSDDSDQVVEQALEVVAGLAREEPHFETMLGLILAQFQQSPALLERRGALVVRRLCVLLGAERIYRQLAAALEAANEDSAALQFAQEMVQALNLILLTAPETADLCRLLRQSRDNPAGRTLLSVLFASWCHSPVAVISLCLLSQAYHAASALISTFAHISTGVHLLVQVDQLVQLLESPIFTYLRLHLLEPTQHPHLIKSLYGLLMLLPQSPAFHTLQTRLQSVQILLQLHTALPSLALSPSHHAIVAAVHETPHPDSKESSAKAKESKPVIEELDDFEEKLAHFHRVQRKHSKHRDTHAI